MGELAGAVAGVQLERLPGILESLRSSKARIVEGVGEIDGLTRRRRPDPDGDGSSSITWFLPDAALAKRFAAALRAEGIPCAQMYRGLPGVPERGRARAAHGVGEGRAVGVRGAPDRPHVRPGPVSPHRGARGPLGDRPDRRRIPRDRLRRRCERGAQGRVPAAVVSVRFAVIGCGNAARQIHLPALRAEGVDITAFASRTRARRRKQRATNGASGAVAERWEDAIERDDVDAVVIAVPNALHREVAVAAANGGKARVGRQADGMHHRGRRRDDRGRRARTRWCSCRSTTRASSRRSSPHSVSSPTAASVKSPAFASRSATKARRTWAPRADWFFDRNQAGGGCLIDLGVHAIDLLRAVTGDDIAAVSALAQRVPRRRRGRRAGARPPARRRDRHDPCELVVAVGTRSSAHRDRHRGHPASRQPDPAHVPRRAGRPRARHPARDNELAARGAAGGDRRRPVPVGHGRRRSGRGRGRASRVPLCRACVGDDGRRLMPRARSGLRRRDHHAPHAGPARGLHRRSTGNRGARRPRSARAVPARRARKRVPARLRPARLVTEIRDTGPRRRRRRARPRPRGGADVVHSHARGAEHARRRPPPRLDHARRLPRHARAAVRRGRGRGASRGGSGHAARRPLAPAGRTVDQPAGPPV